MKRIILVLAVVLLAGCGDNAPTPVFTITNTALTPNEKAEVIAAIEAFERHCPAVIDIWPDVVKATAQIGDSLGYRAEDYGWNREVTLSVTIRDRPSRIPVRIRAGGHTLWYTVGVGAKPGIVMSKAQSQEVCGQTAPRDGSDIFVSAPDMVHSPAHYLTSAMVRP